jgi:hypothetical protein
LTSYEVFCKGLRLLVSNNITGLLFLMGLFKIIKSMEAPKCLNIKEYY